MLYKIASFIVLKLFATGCVCFIFGLTVCVSLVVCRIFFSKEFCFYFHNEIRFFLRFEQVSACVCVSVCMWVSAWLWRKLQSVHINRKESHSFSLAHKMALTWNCERTEAIKIALGLWSERDRKKIRRGYLSRKSQLTHTHKIKCGGMRLISLALFFTNSLSVFFFLHTVIWLLLLFVWSISYYIKVGWCCFFSYFNSTKKKEATAFITVWFARLW